MPNITLPTEAERAAVDTSSFTWSNSEPGSLTKPHGALLKLIGDQLESGEYVQVISMSRGTGKTPKFIAQNTTNGADLKIVLRDDFGENKGANALEQNKVGSFSTFVDSTSRANVKVLLGSVDNVYLQDLDGVIVNNNFVVTYTNTETGAEIVTLDKSGACTPFNDMTTEELNTELGYPLADFHTKEVLLNKDDAKLDGGGDRPSSYDVICVCPPPHLTQTLMREANHRFDLIDSDDDATEQARLEAWIKRDFTIGFLKVWNKLPVGGVAIYDKIHLPVINQAILDGQAHLDVATYDSCLYNNTESDYTGAYQSFAIKKLS